jgi:uncharacterized protein involved in type VI secretion and phage assembly
MMKCCVVRIATISKAHFPMLDVQVLPYTFSSFSAETRLYEIDTPLGTDALLAERWVGTENLSALSEYHVDCLSTDTHIALKRLLGQQAVLRTRLADGTQAARSGYICAVAQLGADGGLARYRLTLKPWLALADYQRRSRVYQDIDLLGIVSDVLSAYAPRDHWREGRARQRSVAGICKQIPQQLFPHLCPRRRHGI